MPRQLRLEYEGAIYHVMNRGDRRERIVGSDDDRESFVATLAEASTRCGWEVHAWCLMGNHFHLVVEAPLGNLVAGMKWFLGTYTIRYNARNRLRGHLFAGRYKSLMVDNQDPAYLRAVADYVHLNPVRAKLIAPEMALESWRWSSYGDYLQPPSRRPRWLRTDRVLGEHGFYRDDRRARLGFARRMEEIRQEDGDQAQLKAIRRGWRFGSEEFIESLLERIQGSGNADNQSRREREESMEQRAERIVVEALRAAGWSQGRLETEQKGHLIKVELAKRLRLETTMSLRWIAERLCMGRWTNVSNLLCATRNSALRPQNQKENSTTHVKR